MLEVGAYIEKPDETMRKNLRNIHDSIKTISELISHTFASHALKSKTLFYKR